MAKKFVVRPTEPRIRNISGREPAISTEEVADAFGARPIGISLGRDASPLTLFQVRDYVMARLRSTGGRPALSDAAKKIKVPLTDGDLEIVETIARKLASDQMKPSPAQVAGVILHMALRRFPEWQIRRAVGRKRRLEAAI